MLVTWPHVKMSLGRRPNCSWWPDGQACGTARSYPWMWMSEGESSCKAIWIIYKLVFMQKRLKVLDVRLNHPASETPSYSLTPCGRIKTPDWWQKTSLQLTEPKQAENTGFALRCEVTRCTAQTRRQNRGCFVWPGQCRGHLKWLRGPWCLLSCDRWGEEFSGELIWGVRAHGLCEGFQWLQSACNI